MAHVRPFAAWRFDHRYCPNPARVILPSAPAMSPSSGLEIKVHAKSLIHPVQPPAEVAALLQEWRRASLLAQDRFPALYPYRQTFSLFGQAGLHQVLGFIGNLRLETGQIFPHEATIPDNLRQRVPYLEALRLQPEPTHGLFQDPQRIIEPLLQEHFGYPLLDLVDGEGVRHQLGRLIDRQVIHRIQRFLEDQPIYLADGHHRLAAHRQFLAQQSGSLDADHPAHFHTMFLSNLHAPDVRILPTHRVLQLPAGFDAVNFWEKLRNKFELAEPSKRMPLPEELKASDAAFAMVYEGQALLLWPKPAARRHLEGLQEPPAVKALDYTLLHKGLLEGVLGLAYAEQAADPRLTYTRQAGDAIKSAGRGSGNMAFLMRELSVQQMKAVCDAGALMPQKSTYFYPKVLGGMLFADLGRMHGTTEDAKRPAG